MAEDKPTPRAPSPADDCEATAPPLGSEFYQGDTADVARRLLGMLLVRKTAEGRCWGRIVETEAYLGEDDSAAHSYRGPTRRNASMFAAPGRAYVYAIHSRWCFNVVTAPVGTGHAVLVRAVAPLGGLDLMASRRGRTRPLELARGPARLCEAFAIDKALDGWELTRGELLWLVSGTPPRRIVASPRVGVTSAHDLPLRFSIAGERFVSLPRAER